SFRTWWIGILSGSVILATCALAAALSDSLKDGRFSRKKIELIALGLLMKSYDSREVSDVPRCWVSPRWCRTSSSPRPRPPFSPPQTILPAPKKPPPSWMNWLPRLAARFSHRGFSGSAGGLIGLNPMWQKPHDIPIKYGGSTELGSL